MKERKDVLKERCCVGFSGVVVVVVMGEGIVGMGFVRDERIDGSLC